MGGSRARRAFTLVELLVVITIIGILIALLLPAVQAAREAARRITCTNNLKQLALALHNYHAAFQTFPINYGGNGGDATNNTGHTWFTGILPYIEQQALFDKINFAAVNGIGDANNTLVSKTPIKGLLCPTDSTRTGIMGNRSNGGGERAINNYKSVAGGNWNAGDHTGVSWPRGKWANNPDGLDYGNGLICRNWSNQEQNYTSINDVRDGTSNTLAIGECVPAWCQWTWWYFPDASTATCGIPLNYRKGQIDLEASAGDQGNNYSFFSQHSGGANFARADGSVGFIMDSIDINLYHSLATISGGEADQAP